MCGDSLFDILYQRRVKYFSSLSLFISILVAAHASPAVSSGEF